MGAVDPDAVAVRPITESDLPDAVRILVASGLCEAEDGGLSRRLRSLIGCSNRLCFVAEQGGEACGILLATFNGFHVFLSHLAIDERHQGHNIAARLHDRLLAHAIDLGAKGIIADSWLTATGFYYKLGYRIPGTVFLIHRLEAAREARG